MTAKRRKDKREPDDIQPKTSYRPDIHRLLPQAPDAERGLIGSYFLDPRRTASIVTNHRITPECYHLPAHGIIAALLEEFHRDNEPIDLIIITEVLRDRGQLDQVGGAAYVTDVAMSIPTAANADYYAKIVKEKHTLRELIKAFTEHLARSYDEQDNVPKLLNDAQDALLKVVRLAEGVDKHSRSMRELVLMATEKLSEAISGDGKIEMPTGIPKLDWEMQGFRRQEVTVLCGKPSDGKTALALNFAEHLAIDHGKRIGILSLEMADVQLTGRLLSSVAWVDTRTAKRDRFISDEDSQRIAGAANAIANAAIYIRDDGAMNLSEIRATLTAWKAEHGLDGAIIDHAQLIVGDGRSENRSSEMEAISRGLKPIAKALDIHLVILSQVTESSPGVFSTKNSKALEEDADNVLVISHTKNNDSWITIAKQREGDRNVQVPVTFLRQYQRFTAKADPNAVEQEAQPELIQ